MPDVFISYAKRTERAAEALAQRLRALGVVPFMDRLLPRPGEYWLDGIVEELKDSPIFVFLGCRDAVAAPTVNQELRMAIKQGAIVIPVLWEVAPDELPNLIRDRQVVDLRRRKNEPDFAREIEDLMRYLRVIRQGHDEAGKETLGLAAVCLGLVLWALSVGEN